MPDYTNIDRIDFELIALLRKNARTSNRALAEAVGLAPSTCLARVQSLIARGIITGFHAEIDPTKIGIGLQAMIAVTLTHHEKKQLEAFQAFLQSLPEVDQFFHVAGPTDFIVHVWAQDAAHLRDLVVNAFTTRAQVKHIETELIFDHTRTLESGLDTSDVKE